MTIKGNVTEKGISSRYRYQSVSTEDGTFFLTVLSNEVYS